MISDFEIKRLSSLVFVSARPVPSEAAIYAAAFWTASGVLAIFELSGGPPVTEGRFAGGMASSKPRRALWDRA